MTMVTESSGALEHKNSYLGMTGRFVTRTRGAYLSWLSTLAHEYFHAWNVKRLRPIELGPFDYENENYVKTLWVAEGFTDYFATILLGRAGILTEAEYLDGLSSQIEQVQGTPGRLVTPVNMASFDTWIKQYRPDENTANMSVNYYPKGAVIAFLLDARIRRATNGARSLDTGMQWAMQRYSGEKGYTPAQFYAVMSEAAGVDLKDWFAKTAESTDELDYTEMLDYYGLRFRPVDPKTQPPAIGGGTRNDNGRLVITSVRRGTAGLDAGLNVDDEIIAIDDVRVRAADGLAPRLAQYRPGDKVTFTVARRDRLMKIDVTLGADPGRPWRLERSPNATDEQKARFQTLMTGQ
jgi:predicted metalloprotease with PDZ domain